MKITIENNQRRVEIGLDPDDFRNVLISFYEIPEGFQKGISFHDERDTYSIAMEVSEFLWIKDHYRISSMIRFVMNDVKNRMPYKQILKEVGDGEELL